MTAEDPKTTPPQRPPPPPGEGERRAVRGLAAQYEVAARLIYDALVNDQLDWIRVADPEAGRLDDIQIATPGRLDAYQVKWSAYEGRLPFSALLKSDGVTPAIIAQLADGWSKLEALHPDRSVQVHFLSREQASTTDEAGEMPDAPGQRHFQAFLKHAYPHRTGGTSFDPTSVPPTPFARLFLASQLTGVQFQRFLPALHFDLGYRLDDDHDQGESRRQADIKALADLLFALVKRDDKRVQFDRSALVAALGWERRLDLRFRHEFPVDERTYRPIAATVRELDGALVAHDRGYLALIGPPGSGKSTTLTQTLRYRPGFRFVRYYAFVRNDTAQGRGEAEAFLSDITVALRRAGFKGRAQNRLPQTLAELQAMLSEQLAALSADWLANGVKTVILVDGLDHIERELKPTHSLFDVLPLPDSVPPGVLVVLGTQKIGLAGLPARIRSQIEQADRSFDIGRLTQQDVSLIALGRAQLAALSPTSLTKVWRLSGGHPLALAYLLEQLSQAGDPVAVETILDSATPFGTDITEDYRVYWDELKADPEVRALLGLVCRLRGGVELEVLKRLAPTGALERFVGRAAHYFTKPATDRWTFFHNSFRQFLIVETGKDAFGRADPDADRVFHKILAEHAAAQPDRPFGWDQLFHLNAAGDDRGILDLFTQDHLRRQFFALRRSSEILEDIALCARAAVKAGDAVAVMRAVLIENEIRERTEALKDADLDALVVSLAEREVLAETAIRDGELRLSGHASLDLASKTYDGGDVFVARRLFDLAEPVDLLSGVRPVSDRSTGGLVEAWARAAWKFHPLDTVLTLIRQVRVVEKRRRRDEDWENPDAAPEAVDPDRFHVRLLRTLGVALIKAHQPADAVVTALKTAGTPTAADELARLEFERVRLGLSGRIDRAEALAAWRRMVSSWTADAIDTGTGSFIITTGLRLGATLAEVEPYSLKFSAFEPGEPDWGDKTIDAFWPVCEQAAVLTALSSEPDPAVAVPDTDRHRSRGAVLFNRMFVVIGAVRGVAIAKRRLPPSEVVRKLGPALSLFRRPWEETHQWSDWHAVRSRAAPYFELILRTADLHGSEALGAVLQALERDWTPKDDKASYWLADWRRAVALCAFELDGDRERTVRWLAEIDGDLNARDDLSERIQHRASQIRAWGKVGERRRAQTLLVDLIADSFAIYHSEDDQLDRWSDLARQALSGADATEVASAISSLLGALPVLMSGHHSAGDTASKRLIAIAARVDPAWGAEVGHWLLDQHGVTRQAALRGLVQGALDGVGAAVTGPIAALAAARLIAPFETSTDREFLERLGRGLAEADREGALFALDRLRLARETTVYPHNRSDWLEAVGEGLKSNADLHRRWGAPQNRPADEHTKPAVFHRKDGTTASLDDALATPAGEPFVAFLFTLANHDQVEWEPLLDAKLGSEGLDRIRKAHDALSAVSPPLAVTWWFARRMAGLGAAEDAWALGEAAYSDTKPSGWMPGWDGEARMMAAELLVELGGDAARHTVLERFTADYLDEVRYPRDLLRWTGRISDLLVGVDAPTRLWPDIAEHVSQLAQVRAGQTSEVPQPTHADPSGLIDPLIQFAWRELADAATEVGDQARRFLVDIAALPQSREPLLAVVERELKNSDEAQVEHALALLECVAAVDSSFPRPLADALIQVVKETQSGSARLQAERILGRLEIAAPERDTRPLPPVYAIHLPNPPQMERTLDGGPERGESLRDTTDPMDLTRLLHRELAWLSTHTGLGFSTLVHRMASLMAQVSPPSEWGNVAEQAMRRRAESSGMRMSYRRLRSLVALRGFSRLVLELTDGEALDWLDPEFQVWLRPVDALLNARDPSPKPSWIRYPEAKEMTADEKVWKQAPAEALSLADLTAPDGRVILGEFTTVERLESRRSVEVRATQRGGANFPWHRADAPDDGFFFGLPKGVLATDYPGRPRRSAALVLRGGGRLTPPYLAFSPAIAAELGWRPAQPGLFAWEDDQGSRMVESLYWRDGWPTGSESRWRDELCGEGWLVLADPKAMARLNAVASMQYLIASRDVEGRAESTPAVERRERVVDGAEGLRRPSLGLLDL